MDQKPEGRGDKANLRILGICGTLGDDAGFAFLWIIELRG